MFGKLLDSRIVRGCWNINQALIIFFVGNIFLDLALIKFISENKEDIKIQSLTSLIPSIILTESMNISSWKFIRNILASKENI